MPPPASREIIPPMNREQFHVPGPGPYALTHSVGCLPKRAVAALNQAFFEPWEAEGGGAWNAWLHAIGNFRESLARLLGGDAGDYCPQANLSAGLAKLLPALPALPAAVGHPHAARVRGTRNVLLAAEDSFPSLVYQLQQANRSGFDTRLLPRSLDPSRLETWEAALSADVAAVLVTHVHSNTGAVAPVAAIAALCRERSILCIVDVAQSAGILPVSVTDFGADVVLGSCVKWLCGGPGAGFLWIRPALVRNLEPTDVGWFSHQDPFEFDVHSFRYAPDVRRFWGGTPSVAPYAIAAAGVQTIADIGVDAIRAHNLALMRVFRDALPAPWRGRIDPTRLGGTVCLQLGAAQAHIANALKSLGVRLDYRGAVVRLSFHVYNTAAEAACIARAFDGTAP